MSNTLETGKKSSARGIAEQGKCPVNHASSGGDLAKKVHVSKYIDEIFSHPVQKHQENYHHLRFDHAKDLQEAYQKLEAAGAKVEDAMRKGKELLEEGANPDMVRHAISIYLTHSKDAQQRRIHPPSLKDHPAFRRIRPSTLPASPMVVTGEVVTADTLQGAALLSYWRDDYDMNDSHYHWHLVYRGAGGDNSMNTRTIDRQGELFLYTHSQMVARYETEGLCWGLPLVRPFSLYDDVLEYGYQPLPALLDYYGGYPAFSSWYRIRNPDLENTPGVTIGVGDMEEWRDNIYEAIKRGRVLTKRTGKISNQRTPRPVILTGENCLNYIGGLLDAQYAFFNPLPDGFEIDDKEYGILHSYGLGKMSEMAYRNNDKEQSPYGIMISNFGAARDPCFYPWNKHMQEFSRLAGARFPQDLNEHRADVILSNLVIRSRNQSSPHYDEGVQTFLGPPAVDLLESKAKLHHEPYEWSVQVKSAHKTPLLTDEPQYVTLRFFIAAKELMNYYHNWIEMDKVTVTLTDESTVKTVVRLDIDSSVARKMRMYGEPDPRHSSLWCGCGWPQNLMLPAGKVEGMPFVAFCMATDGRLDDDTRTPSVSFCGAVKDDDKYPDPCGMGYPFNRSWTQLTDTDTGKVSMSTIISNNPDFPFITSSDFKVFRTTTFRNPAAKPPPTDVTWNNTIKGYFQEADIACMRSELGYNMAEHADVKYHWQNILDAVRNGRMPLQMGGYTQDSPDPKHPLWTAEMVENFRAWGLNDCPK